MRRTLLLSAAAFVSACGPALAQTASVTATAETAPVDTAIGDAADDPAIWRNPRRPAESLIVGTEKKAGLYVYGLDGRVRSFVQAGRVNNVDLVDMGRQGVIVVASNRNDATAAKLNIYRLDTRQAVLKPLGVVDSGPGEAYGLCLLKTGRALHAFSVLKHGAIHQVELNLSGNTASGRIVRSLQVATQAEGCVADPRTRRLYIAEEDRGIWSFDARPDGVVAGQLVAPVDGTQLVADVEGLAIAPSGRRGGWLVVSSQGDSAYARYRLPDMQPAGRFRIAAGRFGSTEETDGIALNPGSFGRAFPRGLFVAQDGDNAPGAQNFKLVRWDDVIAALRPKRAR